MFFPGVFIGNGECTVTHQNQCSIFIQRPGYILGNRCTAVSAGDDRTEVGDGNGIDGSENAVLLSVSGTGTQNNPLGLLGYLKAFADFRFPDLSGHIINTGGKVFYDLAVFVGGTQGISVAVENDLIRQYLSALILDDVDGLIPDIGTAAPAEFPVIQGKIEGSDFVFQHCQFEAECEFFHFQEGHFQGKLHLRSQICRNTGIAVVDTGAPFLFSQQMEFTCEFGIDFRAAKGGQLQLQNGTPQDGHMGAHINAEENLAFCFQIEIQCRFLGVSFYGLSLFEMEAGTIGIAYADGKGSFKFQHQSRFKADKNTGNRFEAETGELGNFSFVLSLDFTLQGNLIVQIKGDEIGFQRNVVREFYREIQRQGAFHLYGALLIIAVVFPFIQLEIQLQTAAAFSFPGSVPETVGTALIAHAGVCNTVAGGFIHGHISGIAVGFHLNMGENIFHVQFRALDGGGGAVHPDGCHLDDQNVVVAVRVGENFTGLQVPDILIGVFNDIGHGLIIHTGNGIHTGLCFQNGGVLCIDGEVGGLVIVQVQNTVGIKVIHRSIQQILHGTGVHGRVIGLAQRRIIIGIHQVGRSVEILRHGAGNGHRGFRKVRADFRFTAGDHLQLVFRVDGHHQNGFLHGMVFHHCGISRNGQIRYTVGAGIFRFFGVFRLQVFAQQIAEAVAALDGDVIVRHLGADLIGFRRNRHHTHQQRQHQNHTQQSFHKYASVHSFVINSIVIHCQSKSYCFVKNLEFMAYGMKIFAFICFFDCHVL